MPAEQDPARRPTELSAANAAAPQNQAPPSPNPSNPVPVRWSVAWQLVGAAGRVGLVGQALLTALQALLPLAGLVAMMRLIDAVAAGLAGNTTAAQALHTATLATVAAAAIAFLGAMARSVSTLVAEDFGRRTGDHLLARVQQHAAALELAHFDRPTFHDQLQRALGEANQRPVRLVQDGLAVLAAVLALGTMAWLLAGVEPWLPLLVAATAMPHALVRRRHARLRFTWQQQHTVEQRDVGYFGAVLTGRASAKDVRTLQLAGPFGVRLTGLRDGLRRSLQRLARARSRDELLVTTLASVGLFAAYLQLVHTALAGGLTLGALVLQAQAAQRAQNGVRDLLAALAGVHEHRLFLGPLVQFLALPAAPATTPPPGPPAVPRPLAITLANVEFGYPEAPALALHDVSLALAAGERLAVVGRNGSGKSTLLKLLGALYAPGRGRVLVDGVPLAAPSPAPWSERIAVLLQDGALFELSVRENLQLGRREPPGDDALWSALGVVGMAERVRALPQGLSTPCSRRHPGGVDWSGGEARRLLLARALAQPADLLLLDEPFAALDHETATAVAATLRTRSRSQTVVVVDHRPAVLGIVDRVLWLDGGRVRGHGTVADLRAAEPTFAALFSG